MGLDERRRICADQSQNTPTLDELLHDANMLGTRPFQVIPRVRISTITALSCRTALGLRKYSVHHSSSDPSPSVRPKVTLANIRKMYMTKQKIAVMTAYDFPSGTFADRAGSDIILVGDSLGMVCLGYESTNQVTLSVGPKGG